MASRSTRSDEAIGYVTAYVGSIAFFLTAFGFLVFHSTSLYAVPDADAAGLKVEVSGIATLLTTTRGTPSGWVASPDGVLRLGLVAEGGGSLDFPKLEALRRGGATDDPGNAAVDHPEAFRALGIEGVARVRIETEPQFLTFTPGGVQGMSGYRLGYVGDIDYDEDGLTHAARFVATDEAEAEADALASLPLLFTNDYYDPGNVVGGVIDADVFADDEGLLKKHLPVRLQGFDHQSSTVADTRWQPVNRSSSWPLPLVAKDAPSGDWVVATGPGDAGGWSYPDNAALALVTPWVDLTEATAANLTFAYALDAGTPPITGDEDEASIRLYEQDDPLLWHTLWMSNRTAMIEFENITVDLVNFTGDMVRLEFRWTSGADGPLNNNGYGWLLDDVVVSAETGNGWTEAYANRMEFERPYHDGLVIGANVKQAHLNPAPVKDAIRAFVLSGGDLYVLGSADAQHSWLAHMSAGFQYGHCDDCERVAVAPSEAAKNVANTPNAWDTASWTRAYDDGALPDGDGGTFEPILYAPEEGLAAELLVTSKPGTLGSGKVVVTALRAADLDEDAGAFFGNILMHQRVNDLFLLYGPEPPKDQQVASASRSLAAPYGENLGTVEVAVIVYLWR